ncbi:hypothetical protein [Kangiella spongicola]|uniref:Uncharacterized protein n=1 Tax=Kangiella spongicola TaxID=796379 RepID=A0A318D5U3_9GAMM|nr:hypothetical protein [Kangiella spongicola]PXF64223.1 hypothetical protein DL796_03555 [Kangiella spongicola]
MYQLLINLYQSAPIILLSLFGMLVIFLLIINAIYFYFRYQKSMEKELLGDDYSSGGFLYDSTRLMMYGHYILFPKRAKKAGVYEFFKNIPFKVKTHLLIHWFGLIIGGICFFVPATITYFQ